MTLAAAPLMTTEDLLAMPGDGVMRELIRGQLREERIGFSLRTYAQGVAVAELSRRLLSYRDATDRNGRVLLDGTFLLESHERRVHVAYVSGATASKVSRDIEVIDAIPILAIEILSPSETQEGILEKVQEYLDCGVKHVWIIEPVMRTITVYRPDAKPAIFTVGQDIAAEPHLPGFKAAVGHVFVD
jgi:Uma2 family endonuclease